MVGEGREEVEDFFVLLVLGVVACNVVRFFVPIGVPVAFVWRGFFLVSCSLSVGKASSSISVKDSYKYCVKIAISGIISLQDVELIERVPL